jgi:hypothetical protein
MTERVVKAIVPRARPTSPRKEKPMERIGIPGYDIDDAVEVDDDDELLIHEWRTEQLRRLGLPGLLAETFADLVDWHALSDLVDRGCSPRLALEIVR